jgi:hypothetical protein
MGASYRKECFMKYIPLSFTELLEERLVSIEGGERGDETITFKTAAGLTYQLYHEQDCCETVTVEDVVGDLQALVGNLLVMAAVETNRIEPPSRSGTGEDSYTWTFYKLADDKGNYVTIRWFGESNGYYSERVTFAQVLRGD